METNKVTEIIIGSAIRIHRTLGPGLMESSYEACMVYELTSEGLNFQRQMAIPVMYGGVRLDCGYRVDLVVEDRVVVELKSVAKLEPIHDAQLLTYLKLSKYSVGLIINFNVLLLSTGIRRLVNNFKP